MRDTPCFKWDVFLLSASLLTASRFHTGASHSFSATHRSKGLVYATTVSSPPLVKVPKTFLKAS
eukprot:3942716-Amphidinium_carterae.1